MRLALAMTVAAAVFAAAAGPGRADSVKFLAQLNAEGAAAGAAKGSAALSFDTASRTLQWRIEYSGLRQPPRALGCGALDAPTGPAIWVSRNLASPITGSQALTDAQIAALGAGRWVCVLNSEEADIGGAVKAAR